MRRSLLPELIPPRPLSADEVLSAELSSSPPDGFPSLPPKQASLVRRRVMHPDESWTASLRAAGYSEGQTTRGRAQISAAGAMYLRAVALFSSSKAGGAADLRAAAIDRLAREVRDAPDGRVAVAAAKVLTDYLPPVEQPAVPALTDLGDDELLSALVISLEKILSNCEAILRCRPGLGQTMRDPCLLAVADRFLALARRFAHLEAKWDRIFPPVSS